MLNHSELSLPLPWRPARVISHLVDVYESCPRREVDFGCGRKRTRSEGIVGLDRLNIVAVKPVKCFYERHGKRPLHRVVCLAARIPTRCATRLANHDHLVAPELAAGGGEEGCPAFWRA